MRFRPLSYDPYVMYDILVRRIYGAIPQNCSIIDIGAHIGAFTLSCIRSRASRVLAFEPESRNFKLLRENILTNHLTNVQAFRLGVWSENETKVLFTTLGSAFHSFYPDNHHVGGFETVNCVGINTVLDGLQPPVFVKVDAEGSEYEIIDHISNRNAAKICGMVLEYHVGNSILKANLPSLLRWFTSNGFKVFLAEGTSVLTAISNTSSAALNLVSANTGQKLTSQMTNGLLHICS